MFGKIFCVNVKNLGVLNGEFVYCGRKCGKYEGSVLGNRFRIGVDGNRDEVIEKYRKWLFENYEKGEVKKELDRLVDILMNGENVYLGCWCIPLNCHIEVIKRCLLYLMKGEV